jgi:16S rRNA (guanine966-N2)-methyltransferase
MMAKVREALFNSLTYIDLFSSQDVRILDIFSGSGSIGLEALSRGATHATFVDFSQNCIQTSLKNAENLGFSTKANGVCGKAEDVLKNPSAFSLSQPYQLITLTPPYEEVVYKELISCLINSPLIQENSIVVIEYPVEMVALPYIIEDSLYGMRNRRYGRTVLATYVFKPTRTFDMRPDEFILSR